MQPQPSSSQSELPHQLSYQLMRGTSLKAPQSCWTRTINSTTCHYLLLTLFIAICLAVGVLLILFTPTLLTHLQPVFYWISQYYITGYALYMLLLITSLIIFIPETIFILAASLMYKQAIGFTSALIFTTLTTFLAQMVGAGISFYFARNCCRKCVRRCLLSRYEMMKALDSGFLIHGIKLVVLMRLSILVPMVVVNYVLGITSVSFKHYMLGSCVLIVNNAILVFFGCSLDTFSQVIHGNYKGGPWFIVVVVISVVLCISFIIVTILITRHYMKKLEEEERIIAAQSESEHALLDSQDQ